MAFPVIFIAVLSPVAVEATLLGADEPLAPSLPVGSIAVLEGEPGSEALTEKTIPLISYDDSSDQHEPGYVGDDPSGPPDHGGQEDSPFLAQPLTGTEWVPLVDGLHGAVIDELDGDTFRAASGSRTFPYRSYTYLRITRQGGLTGSCSGWLVNTNKIITSAHCVHDGPGGNVFQAISVTPDYSAAGSNYGTCNVTAVSVLNEFTSTTGNYGNYDLGAAKLDCTVGQQTGFIGYQVRSSPETDAQIRRSPLTGYDGAGVMRNAWGTVEGRGRAESDTGNLMVHSNQSTGGMSGGPRWSTATSCSPCAHGINRGGHVAIWINNYIFQAIQYWKHSW